MNYREELLAIITIIMLALLLPFITSCSTTPTTRPAGCENSIIYKVTGDQPSLASAISTIVITEALIAKPEAAPYVRGAIENLLGLLEDDQVTYIEFATAATQNIKWVNQYFGQRLAVYTPLLSAFDKQIPISQCDTDLIRKDLTALLTTLPEKSS